VLNKELHSTTST